MLIVNNDVFFLGFLTALCISPFLIIICLEIRKKISIKVKCWFCNSSNKVPYINKNSFNCRECEQYNGFSEDGGYNKVIPEQHDEFLNHIISPQNSDKQKPRSNGLCKLCNNNQHMKVLLLAKFAPMNEEKYDSEVEHFEQQLERVYKLCPRCNVTAKKTISQQNQLLLGHKVAEIRKSGSSLLFFRSKLRGRLSTAFAMLFLFLQVLFCSIVLFEKDAIPTNFQETHKIYLIGFSFFFILGTQWIINYYLNTKEKQNEVTKKENLDASNSFINYANKMEAQKSLNISDPVSYQSFKSEHNQSQYDSHSTKSSKKNSSPKTTENQANTSNLSNLSCTLEKLDICPSEFSKGNYTKKPIIAASKLQNPWSSGTTWDSSSRCSSQSSGICSNYNSRSNSVCDERDLTFCPTMGMGRSRNYANERVNRYLNYSPFNSGFSKWSSSLHNNTFCSNFGSDTFSDFNDDARSAHFCNRNFMLHRESLN